jgi:hypothetical protein
VYFFVVFESVWKYDYLYRLLKENSFFNPIILVIPYTGADEETMLVTLNKTYQYFKTKDYNTVSSLKENNEWLILNKELQPDIIFFTLPYNYTKPQYTIGAQSHTLTCYSPYFFVMNNLYENNYNTDFHNSLWKAFYETDVHYNIARKYSERKALNVIVSGYPGLDTFVVNNDQHVPFNNEGLKTIIIAPHHTIGHDGDTLFYSNFLNYSDFFLELCSTYENQVRFVFKPHPLLKQKLYLNENWGKKKTDTYFEFWNSNHNTELCEGNYVKLFLHSDGLIHDCGSFLTEYLMTNKPVLYLHHDNQVYERMNEFGQSVLKTHYKGFSKEDIKIFYR